MMDWAVETSHLGGQIVVYPPTSGSTKQLGPLAAGPQRVLLCCLCRKHMLEHRLVPVHKHRLDIELTPYTNTGWDIDLSL